MGVALVTGASSGIGRAIAIALARIGDAVAVHYGTQGAKAEEAKNEIVAAGGKAIVVGGDMGSERDIVSIFQTVDRELGPITSLVNNAGSILAVKPIAEIDTATVERILSVNLAGVIYCCREAVKRMSTARGGRGGAILNISSMAAVLGGLPNEVPMLQRRAALIPSPSGSHAKSQPKASA